MKKHDLLLKTVKTEKENMEMLIYMESTISAVLIKPQLIKEKPSSLLSAQPDLWSSQRKRDLSPLEGCTGTLEER